jgi:hypothetical protein
MTALARPAMFDESMTAAQAQHMRHAEQRLRALLVESVTFAVSENLWPADVTPAVIVDQWLTAEASEVCQP